MLNKKIIIAVVTLELACFKKKNVQIIALIFEMSNRIVMAKWFIKMMYFLKPVISLELNFEVQCLG